MDERDRILLDVPVSFESERLIIRAPRPGEGAALHEAIVETLDDLKPWCPWANEPQTVESAEAYARRASAEFTARRDLAYRFWLKDGGAFVGGGGLHPRDWAVPRFAIGYWCRKRFQGQGYVTEGVRALARVGFESLRAQRIEITCDSRNERSRRVAERVGFRLEGELVNERRAVDGRLSNTLLFALTP
jgi:RimJ/RimL family protein N-acetyltransferase